MNVVVAADAEFAEIAVDPLLRVHEYVYGDVPPLAVTVVDAVVIDAVVSVFSMDVGTADAPSTLDIVSVELAMPVLGGSVVEAPPDGTLERTQ